MHNSIAPDCFEADLTTLDTMHCSFVLHMGTRTRAAAAQRGHNILPQQVSIICVHQASPAVCSLSNVFLHLVGYNAIHIDTYYTSQVQGLPEWLQQHKADLIATDVAAGNGR